MNAYVVGLSFYLSAFVLFSVVQFELCGLCNCKSEVTLNPCVLQTRAMATMGKLLDEGDTRLATNHTDDPRSGGE